MTLFEYRLGTTLTVGQILSWDAKVEKKDSRKPNILIFSCLYSNLPQLNDEVKYYDLDNNQVFGGYIQNITTANGISRITVADYSVRLSQLKFSAVYNSTSPEAIIEDIIDTQTDLTFSSSVSTGTSISMLFRDEWLIDGITKLMELFSGKYTVGLDRVFTLDVEGESISTEVIDNSVDVLQGAWETDIQKKAEKVIVVGAIIDQRTTETLTGTGTVFYTTYIPENVEITGLKQTTETITGDYEVDKNNLKITFNTSKTDPVVSYTYKSQVRVEYGTGKTALLEKKYIETKFEARRLAIEYKTRFEDGSQSAKWLKNSSNINNFKVGDMIYVFDLINEIDQYFMINEVVWELPKKMIINVGETESDLFDQQKETIERIKQLEKTNTNSDFITKFEFLEENVTISADVEFYALFGVVDNGKVLFASETELDSNADLISDTGLDEDFALAYDNYALPSANIIDYRNPSYLLTEDGEDLITEDGEIIRLE